MNTIKDRLSTLIFYLSILFFLIGFQFSDNRAGGWYQQFMPNIGNKQIKDITFLDSLTGYAVANQYPTDSNYVLKTTNRGDNWQIIHRQYLPMQHIQFLNLNTGYSCAGYLYRTIDGGYNWNPVNTSGISAGNMYVLNQDTIWLTDADGFVGGIFWTINGGVSWQRQANFGSGNPDKIYMYNGRFGFASRNGGVALYRTTNSGQNWNIVPGADGFRDIYFVDTLVGWKTYLNIKKTTDGGLNWIAQTTAQGGIIQSSFVYRFSNVSRDTLWGTGGYVLYPNNQTRGILHRTTNGGTNWLFQIPDTSIHLGSPAFIDFVDHLKGWGYQDSPTGIHTTTGGDDTFYTNIKQISSNIPDKFYLGQNYPNPFNPKTSINYELSRGVGTGQVTNYVVLSVFDITGRHIVDLVNQKQNVGSYKVIFDGSNYSSGVYFYSLIIDGITVDTKRMVLLK